MFVTALVISVLQQLSTDVCVPISKLAEVITETKQDIIDHSVVGKNLLYFKIK